MFTIITAAIHLTNIMNRQTLKLKLSKLNFLKLLRDYPNAINLTTFLFSASFLSLSFFSSSLITLRDPVLWSHAFITCISVAEVKVWAGLALPPPSVALILKWGSLTLRATATWTTIALVPTVLQLTAAAPPVTGVQWELQFNFN